MEETRKVILTVVMAADYYFTPGEEVHISKRDGLYYVSCDCLDFGLAKEVLGNVIKDEGELGCEFDATVVAIDFENHQLEVRAELPVSGS